MMMLGETRRRIEHAIHKIYSDDADLFGRSNYELTVSAKLAQYLFIEFKEYDVDCEYDKHIDGKKHSQDLDQNVRPDIVIHKRGRDDENLVYVEIKKEQNKKSRKNDREKIKAMTRKDGEFQYLLGVFIDFRIQKKELNVEYYQDGTQIIEQCC